MKRTELSHFSHLLAAVQRTGSLPGGSIRGLPDGRAIDGLQGFHTFALEVSEAQREFKLGRIRAAVERVKQLEIQFNGIAARWDASISSLISDIRQGKQLKNLEKLKELKGAQVRMQQLVSPARKAFQDLVTALDHDAITEARTFADTSSELQRNKDTAESGASPEPNLAPTDSVPTKSPEDWTPDADDLANFATNYRCGSKLQLARDAADQLCVVPELEPGSFYYVAGLEPPRVIRVREHHPDFILVFDTLQLCEATLTTDELAELIPKGIWVLVSDN